MSAGSQEIEEIGPEEAHALVEGGAYLLDVREHDEWDAGHAPAAHHIPLGELEARYLEIPREVTVVCVCRVGGRSAHAAAALGSVGYEAVNLAGGMYAWGEASLPLVATDGPGRVL
jgi:rhodanese-related sulfurtransferase